MEFKTECVILLPPNGKTLAVRRWWIQPEHKLTPQNDEIEVERNESSVTQHELLDGALPENYLLDFSDSEPINRFPYCLRGFSAD